MDDLCVKYIEVNPLEANVVQPKTRGKVTCNNCGLKYTNREYRLLKEAKKLIFFNFMDKTYCHSCFCNQVVKFAEISPKIRVLDNDKEFTLNFESYI